MEQHLKDNRCTWVLAVMLTISHDATFQDDHSLVEK